MMEDSRWRQQRSVDDPEQTLARAGEPAPLPPRARDETGFERTLQGPTSERSRAASSNVAEPSPPSIPDVRLDALLGRGGQGVVYRGRQTYLERDVAVKVLRAGADADFEQRFRREARILAGLSDPHIVACYQAGVTEDGRCYLVMEFIDGPDLARWIDAHGKLDVRDALTLARDLARALEHAHSVGILHRDVKPQNVLLAPNPAPRAGFAFRAKLADLGLARGGAGELALTQLTAPGAIMGTPATMAPEQFDDASAVDLRADIYGLGCVLYHALVGQCAYSGQTLGQVIRRKSAAIAPDPAKLNPAVPPGVSRLVQRMLAARRENRPSSYVELIAELEQQLAALDAPSGNSRRRALALGGIASAMLACAYVVWAAWPERELNTPAADAGVASKAPDASDVASNSAPADAPGIDQATSTDNVPPPAAVDVRPLFPAGARWRPFQAWTSLDELLAVDGWRRTPASARAVWGCVEGELDALLANSPSGPASASRELPRGAWTLRGELWARRAFGWESQEARAGVRLALAGQRVLEWEFSSAPDTTFLRWRHARRQDEQWRSASDAASGALAVDDEPLSFECAFDRSELTLTLVRGGEREMLGAVDGLPLELELFVEGGMGQWRAFEFRFH